MKTRVLPLLLCLLLLIPAALAEPAPELLLKLAALDSVPALAGLEALPEESGPGARGSHVLLLQTALSALQYLDETQVSGVFTPQTARAVQAFQADGGLLRTGRADRDTLGLLFLRPATVPGRTQLPFWYGGGSDLIPLGAFFTVKDVRTGIRFEAYRMMGESHLDAEPVTREDTELMKTAYGGEWSWDRRPVLLNYRGTIIAASMNGMPHGYIANRENGMGGHFCIHFAYARGDGTQRVDTDHLQAAWEAYQTGWDDPGTQTIP